MKRFGLLPVLLFLSCPVWINVTPIAPEALGQGPGLSADSLHSLLEQGLEAFSRNDFSLAADLFQRLERDFGQEPEFNDPMFLRRMLPLKGHAELSAGLPSAAANTLGRFVDNFRDDPQRPAALFALAMALQRDNRIEEALERLREFEQTYPNRPEAALALIQRAEILFERDETGPAMQLLTDFSISDAPAIFRHQARLRAARHMIGRRELQAAAQLLLDYPWEIDSLAEITVLSFAALELGDLLLETGEAAGAIRAYRLVLPRSRLLELQQARLREIQTTLQRIGGSPGAGRFWSDYYRRLLDGMIRQTEALQTGDDFTPALLLRRGQAMLLASRHHEAWLLFERLALDDTVAPATRQDAHYRWILAATGLELWEEALTIARTFLRLYPDAPLTAETIYLIAQAHQEQRRYSEASDILAELQTRFPDHPLAQRWRFTQGFNETLQENFGTARSHFRKAADDFPEGQLAVNAELWLALTFFFERDYATALAQFEQLAERYPNHSLTPEIHYRRASTLYAMREYDGAEHETAAFIERFPAHPRHDEALVLLGDIRMGAGRLDEAMNAFAGIQPEMGHIYLYGLFQQGKILRARQQYQELISLFSHYVDRPDIDPKARLSEALYWIGWAHTQLDQREEAVPLFLSALKQHGNDPESVEIGSMLTLLETLFPLPGSDERSFSSWLDAERQQAVHNRHLTYFSRLTLHLAQRMRRQNRPHQAENLLFEIARTVPVEMLGADALAAIGHMLARNELQSANEFFETLLKTYPAAPERAFAFHGLGFAEFRQGNYESALTWLRRFEHETPTHELAAEVLQLSGEALLRLGRLEEAGEKFEEILRLRTLRGRPHALALLGLAQTMEEAQRPERAIAYYQRIYTVHRAQTDLTAKAYYRSSHLFEELGENEAAHRTLTEMLSLDELSGSPYFEQAREREAVLAAVVVPETIRQQEHDNVE